VPTAEGRKTTRGVLPLAVTGITVWLLLVAPVLPPDRQLGERDSARLLYPVEKTVAAALRAGRLPLWDSRIESGASILGQVTPAALHPFALLYLPLPFGLAFKLEHLLALLLGGCGAALLAAQLGASGWPALLAGIAFGGSGALVSSASGALPYALGPAAAPLAVAGLLWFSSAPSAGRLLGSAFALALCAYGGDPQSFGIAILVALVLGIVERSAGWALRIGRVLVWAACGFLLCAPAALPAVSQLQRSERREGITDVERKMFFAPPVRLFGLAVPLAFDGSEPERGKPGDPYSEFIAGRPAAPFLNSICLGAPALLFAAAAMRRKRAVPLLAMAALLVVASAGPAWHLQPLLEAVIPGWRLFRFTEKFVLHASWLLAAAAAIGADDALRGARDRARPLAWFAGVATVVALGAFLLCVGQREALLQRLTQAGYTHAAPVAVRFLDSLRMGTLRTAGLCAAVAAIAVLRLLREGSQVPAALAAAAAAASSVISPPLHTVRADMYESTSATARKLFEIGGTSEGRWRVWADANRKLALPDEPGLDPDEERLVGFREALWPQLQVLDGIDGAAPYFSAVDRNYSAVLKDASDAALDILAIRFYVVQPGPDVPPRAYTSDSGFRILERPPSPRAFLVHRTRRAATRDAAIADLGSMKIHEEAIVSADGPLLSGAGAATPVALRRQVPERIEASVQAAAEGLLVVSEHYDPGWRAQVDGQDVPVHPADVIVLGILVPAGRHEVRLRFIPVGFVPGVFCAALTALVLGAFALRHSPRPYSRIL
jgi:hypothetical protein